MKIKFRTSHFAPKILILLQTLPALTCPIPSGKPTTTTRLDWTQYAPKRNPAATPNFGGENPTLWSPEAQFANAGEKYLAEVKARSGIRDVWISIPVKLENSGYNPFGDGQSNSRIHFPGWKNPQTLPYMAALIMPVDKPQDLWIEVRFHPAIGTQSFSAKIVSVANTKEEGTLSISKVPDQVAPTIRISLGHLSPKTKLEILSGQWGFWISGSGWKDGFPILFQASAWRNIAKVENGLFPSLEEEFKGLKFFASAPNIDPQRLREITANLPKEKRPIFAFAKAQWKMHQDGGAIGFQTSTKNFGKFSGYPAKPSKKSPPMSVHGEFKQNYDAETAAYTAVGGVVTRYVLKDQNGSNVKHLYTCFTSRTPEMELVKQPQNGAPPGLPSGAGWHRVGDPAETVLNSLESSAILTAVATETPFGAAASGQRKFSYDLDSTATLRWTEPGEAFVTSQKEHHWYAVHDPTWPVCTEILVHPFVPNAKNALGMKGP